MSIDEKALAATLDVNDRRDWDDITASIKYYEAAKGDIGKAISEQPVDCCPICKGTGDAEIKGHLCWQCQGDGVWPRKEDASEEAGEWKPTILQLRNLIHRHNQMKRDPLAESSLEIWVFSWALKQLQKRPTKRESRCRHNYISGVCELCGERIEDYRPSK